MRRYLAFLLLGCTLFLLSGCSAFVDAGQTAVDPTVQALLAPGHPVGQTFVARHAGLDGIQVWLQPQPGSQGVLRLHLRAGPDATDDLAISALPVPDGNSTTVERFTFAALPDSNNRYLYAFWELDGQGAIRLNAAPGAAYRDGSLYLDHTPADDGQLAFQLVYDRGPMLLDLVRFSLSSLGLVLIALVIFVVPGWAIVAWSTAGARLSWAEILGLAAGLGVGLPALVLLWTGLAGLHLGALNVWLPVAIGVLLLGWRYRATRWPRLRLGFQRWACSDALWPDLALLFVLVLLFFTRLLVIRALDAPSWGDSVQHAVMGQLFLDHGGMFSSWEPYAPYRTLSVHYGFSAIAAWLAWAAGLTSVQATLVAGQLVNAFSVLCLYPVATRLAKGNRWAGVTAVLVAGLLSSMPAFYVNWGRYAQLAAQVVLPVAFWYLMEALESERPWWPAALVAGLAVAEMTLGNYRLPYFYALFVAVWLLVQAPGRWRLNWHKWVSGLGRLAVAAGCAVVFFLPYRSHISAGRLTASVDQGLTNVPPVQSVIADYEQWRQVTTYLALPLLILALVALVWSLWRRRWGVTALGIWVLLQSLVPATQLIPLPGAYMIQTFAILIALYIPAALLIGWLAGEFSAWLARFGNRRLPAGLMLASVVMALWGAGHQVEIVTPGTIMVNRPDTRAMAWLQQNTRPDARILVEGFTIWNTTSAVGSDAGWWIPLLAHRANTMPPQYALADESPIEKDYSQRIVDIAAQVEKSSFTDPATLRLLCREHVTHVYVGASQGTTGGTGPLFRPRDLTASPAFRQVYHQDRVYVFELAPHACQGAGSSLG